MYRNTHVFYEQTLCLGTSFINESHKMKQYSYIKMAILYSKFQTEPHEALSDCYHIEYPKVDTDIQSWKDVNF